MSGARPADAGARRPSGPRRGWAALDRPAKVAAVLLGLLALAALLAPWLPLADPQAMDPELRLEPPRWTSAPHPLTPFAL